MIEIVLKDGKVFKNDPEIGFNSSKIDIIRECLQEFNEYTISFKGAKITVNKEQVLEIRET
ncbi:MAG: hypothetical protein Q8920_11465 [Bacillota bacterium]|nr:hypothetical protein [Bacillota bacterium]